MSKKELFYFEDALGHENNICAYIEYAISSLKNESLKEFMDKELTEHQIIISDLTKRLENLVNEW